MGTYVTKRIYERPEPEDGVRVLVDRLWPRGVPREQAELDEWARDLAPSTELRTWFAHRADRFEEFGHRYRSELDDNPVAAHKARQWGSGVRRVTLLYATRDPEVNHAVVLRSWLAEHLPEGPVAGDPGSAGWSSGPVAGDPRP